ncbi:MAG TPA: ABC transporter permease [Saprospiraceae bacterium]|nr:ABC transporter permease [Saprospiraceae bacterium]HMQ84143.1 ABC transporter permease [Saprospiraceae bacterium]
MLQNYIKIALRNLLKYRGYTLINVLGLGIGMAATVWAFQNYRFCYSFDNFHDQSDRVFRGIITKEGNEALMGVFPLPIALQAKEDFPNIEATVRYQHYGVDIKPESGEPFAEQVHFTDAAFFDCFHFPLLEGSNDLSNRNAILLTEKLAKKYFGDAESLGKTLAIYAGSPFQKNLTVTGVLQDVPMNSTLRFDLLTHFDNFRLSNGEQLDGNDWTWLADAVFFKLKNADDAASLANHFDQYLGMQHAAREDFKVSDFKLIALDEAAKMQRIGANNLFERPEDSAVYGPLVLALLILLASCLNFTNTTVARSGGRLKEMGIRKVMGSTRAQLSIQMLLEATAIVILAFVLSVIINWWWLPTFDSMFLYTDTQADYLHDHLLLAFVVGAIAGTTLLAGAYPAFYISRFNPAHIFKGSVKFGGSNLFSRILLGLQVVISLITVIAGVGFSQNAAFQRHYDYGYSHENILIIPANDSSTLKVMEGALQQMPSLDQVAGSNSLIGFSYRWRTIASQGVKKEVNFYEVGAAYPNIMDMTIKAGRGFDPNLQTDYESALLVNEKMAEHFGWSIEAALGQTIQVDSLNYTVVGVLKDFHSNNLFNPIEPAALCMARPQNYHNLVVKAQTGQLSAAFAEIKSTWEKLFPLTPFRGFYQNEVTGEALRVTSSIAKIFFWFAIVTVLLTATGLFALVSLTVVKRMREIAIRKVLGATPADILGLVNKGYVWIFSIAVLLGCYGGYTLTKLLMDMIFQINAGIHPGVLLLSSLVVVFIALMTAGIKVASALRSNPAEVLKGD